MKNNWFMYSVCAIGSLVGGAMLMMSGSNENSTLGKVFDYGMGTLLSAGAAYTYAKALFDETK